jgi:hypothetical protein
MKDKKRIKITGGELRDNPGYWKIDGQYEGEVEKWSFVRKPDGSIWDVARVDLFPPDGQALARITISDQVTDEDIIAEVENHYQSLRRKEMENAGMKEKDRVRVIRTGTPGTIIGFGSIPGVPTLVNVAYDGGGGCNHRPDELELIRENELDFMSQP